MVPDLARLRWPVQLAASAALCAAVLAVPAPSAAQGLYLGRSPPDRAYFDPFNLSAGDGRWYVTGYAGVLAANKLSRIVRFDADLQSDPFVAVGLGREFGALASWLRLEWEVNLGVRFEPGATIADIRAMVGLRYTAFPWNDFLPTTFAVMTGPSYLSAPSDAFERRKGQTERFTNGMAFELTFALPDRPDRRAVFRIHHRSPLFGQAGEASPSDAVTLGLQFRF